MTIAGDLIVYNDSQRCDIKLSERKEWFNCLDICDAQIDSLEGCPETVNGFFSCANCGLTSLKYCPITVSGSFNCSGNKLTSLEGCPKTSFNGNSTPDKRLYGFFGYYFDVSHNEITSIEKCPNNFSTLNISFNKITNLHDIHKIIKSARNINLNENPIESHILGLLKIDKLKIVSFADQCLSNIINKYLPLGDLFACQEELMEAGYEEFAQL